MSLFLVPLFTELLSLWRAEDCACVPSLCGSQYKAAAGEIELHAPKDLPLDLFLVNCSEMNEQLIQITASLTRMVLSYVERCVGYVVLLPLVLALRWCRAQHEWVDPCFAVILALLPLPCLAQVVQLREHGSDQAVQASVRSAASAPC